MHVIPFGLVMKHVSVIGEQTVRSLGALMDNPRAKKVISPLTLNDIANNHRFSWLCVTFLRNLYLKWFATKNVSV